MDLESKMSRSVFYTVNIQNVQISEKYSSQNATFHNKFVVPLGEMNGLLGQSFPKFKTLEKIFRANPIQAFILHLNINPSAGRKFGNSPAY